MWEIAIFHKEKGDTVPILHHWRYTRFLVFWPTWCVLSRPTIEVHPGLNAFLVKGRYRLKCYDRV